MDQKIHYFKDVNSPNVIKPKSLQNFFKAFDKLILKCTQTYKGSRMIKISLKKNDVRELALSAIKAKSKYQGS